MLTPTNAERHLLLAFRRGKLRALKPRALAVYLALLHKLNTAADGMTIRTDELAAAAGVSIRAAQIGAIEVELLHLVDRQRRSKELGTFYQLVW